jgi:hypothetical protein
MISTFLLQLGAGCLMGVLPVPARATGRDFNRFVALLAAVILILGFGLALRGTERPPTTALWSLTILCAVGSAAASHAGRLGAGRLMTQAAVACSLPALALEAFHLASRAGGDPVATIRYLLDAWSSAWLLGSVLIAMILGHYYLNIAGLDIRHLTRLCLIAMAAVGVRTVAFGWGLAAGGASLLGPGLMEKIAAGGDVLPFVVLLQRGLFGIAGAAALCTMAWRTARISSTQSATGILYIGFIAVLVGELASRYLLFGTGHPL